MTDTAGAPPQSADPTTPAISSGSGSAADATRLGRAVARRLRLPGPSVDRPLRRQIGVLAHSVERFAGGLSRPVEIRQALRGPGGSYGTVRPPRWWTPVASSATDAAAPSGIHATGGPTGGRDGTTGSTVSAADDGSTGTAPAGAPREAALWLRPARPMPSVPLPERGLPRAARAVEDEQSYTPGGMLTSLTSVEARVRREAEVAATGPMLTQHDRARLTATTRRPPAEPSTTTSTTTAAAAPTTAAPTAAQPRPATLRRHTSGRTGAHTTRHAAGTPTTPSEPSGPSLPATPGGFSTTTTPSAADTAESVRASAGPGRPSGSESQAGPSGPRSPGTRPTPTAPSGEASATGGADHVGDTAAESLRLAPASRTRAPWALAATPARFSRALRRSARPVDLAHSGTPSAIAPAATPIRAATLGLLDRAPALPGHIPLRVPSSGTSIEARGTDTAAQARTGTASVGTRGSDGARPLGAASGHRPQAVQAPSDRQTQADRQTQHTAPAHGAEPRHSAGPPEASGPASVTDPAQATASRTASRSPVPAAPVTTAGTERLHSEGSSTTQSSAEKSSTGQSSTGQSSTGQSSTGQYNDERQPSPSAFAPGARGTVRRHARAGTSTAAPGRAAAAQIAMPDQLVVRRWARHGRRNTALATGFDVTTPIRPATLGAHRAPAPPLGTAAGPRTTPAAGPGAGAPIARRPGAYGAAPWVVAAPGGAAAGPPVGTIPGAPSGPSQASVPGPVTTAAAGLLGAQRRPFRPLPMPPPAFGGAWSPAPVGTGTGDTVTSTATDSTATDSATGTGAADAAPMTDAPADTGQPNTRPADSAPSGTGSSGSATAVALLRALPVAPPRAGMISADPAAPPRPSSVPGGPGLPPARAARAASAPAPASFTPEEIERLRGGSGSLLARTAHLFGPGPLPVRGHGSESSPGGFDVFHETSSGGISPAPAASAPVPADPADPASRAPALPGEPWSAGLPEAPPAMADQVEPTGAVLDRLVDAVVERIEDRVIDELHRRGRHEWRVI